MGRQTEYALLQRYGQPTETKDLGQNRTQFHFQKDGWIIDAFLYYGNCQCIIYFKPGNRDAAAQEKLMQANAAGTQWYAAEKKNLPMIPLRSGEAFARSDGNAYAMRDDGSYRFYFFTKQWAAINKPKPVETKPLPNF